MIVAFPKREDAAKMKSILMRSGYDVSGVCTGGVQVIALAGQLESGLVICGYRLTDMLYSQLKEDLPSGFQMLLVASAARLGNDYTGDVVSIEMPLKINELVNTIDMMSRQLFRERRKKRTAKKARTEQEEQLILEAKTLLMERNKMSEEEAYRYMQKTSMDSGTNLVETAGMIVTLFR